MLDRNAHEKGFVASFIQKNKQERCVGFLSDDKSRRKFTRELAHFKWLDEKYVKVIPPKMAHTVDEWAALLRSKGAPAKAWLISEWSKLDEQEVDLETALKEIRGAGMGTIVSCVPGKLCYFEDEERRLLLERSPLMERS